MVAPRDRDVASAGTVINKYSRQITQMDTAGAGQAQCKKKKTCQLNDAQDKVANMEDSVRDGFDRWWYEQGSSRYHQFVSQNHT